MSSSGGSSPVGRPRGSLADFQDSVWRTGVFRGAVIGVLAASLVVAPMAILRALTTWELGYLLPLAFSVALLGIVSTNQLGQPNWRDRRGLAYRLGEGVLIVLATRLAVWGMSIGWPDRAALGVLLRHPAALFDIQTVVVAALLLSVWRLAVGVTADFAALAIGPDEVAMREADAWGDSRSALRLLHPVGRREVVMRFASRWAWGGLPLVIFTGLSQLGVSQDSRGLLKIGFEGMGLGPDVLAGLLCYFLAGLVLLSDARLAVLRGQWYNERVTIAPALLRRWHWLGLVVLIAVAVIALLLPLGPVGPFARALEWLIALLARIALLLWALFVFLVSVLSYPLRWLMRRDAEPPASEIGSMKPPAPAEAPAQILLPDWLPGAVAWAVIGLVAGYLLFDFLRGRNLLPRAWGGWLASLRAWWRARRHQIDMVLRSTATALQARLRRGREAAPGETRAAAVRFRALPPRGKVRYFYLRMAQAAAEAGHVRLPHETPTEYARTLETAWPEAGEEVQGLTEAFLDARYAPVEVGPDQALSAQAVWQRLMRALRGSTHRSGT